MSEKISKKEQKAIDKERELFNYTPQNFYFKKIFELWIQKNQKIPLENQLEQYCLPTAEDIKAHTGYSYSEFLEIGGFDELIIKVPTEINEDEDLVQLGYEM